MEEDRILDYISIKKPILVLDNRFEIVKQLEAGESGQLQINGYLEREWVEQEIEQSIKYGKFKVLKAEKVNARTS